MAKHRDSYIKSKMEDDIRKSLSCLKEITRYLKESQEVINQCDAPEWNNVDRLYAKAYCYDKIIETYGIYFPNKVKESDNDFISE